MQQKPLVHYNDFEKIDIRTGKIISAEILPGAKKPAYVLAIDFGDEFGTKRSSAQITENYTPEELLGSMVVAVINFSPKQIANFISEVLVLGVNDESGAVCLLRPDRDVPLGSQIY